MLEPNSHRDSLLQLYGGTLVAVFTQRDKETHTVLIPGAN